MGADYLYKLHDVSWPAPQHPSPRTTPRPYLSPGKPCMRLKPSTVGMSQAASFHLPIHRLVQTFQHPVSSPQSPTQPVSCWCLPRQGPSISVLAKRYAQAHTVNNFLFDTISFNSDFFENASRSNHKRVNGSSVFQQVFRAVSRT